MKVKVINKSNNKLPQYETKGSAGLDLASAETKILYGNSSILVKTGLFLEIPEGYEAQIRPRSGLAVKHMVTVLNSPGTIDCDYRGEIGIVLINHSRVDFPIKEGDRVAQMVFAKVEQAEFEVEKELSETDRGEGGFGHTGKD